MARFPISEMADRPGEAERDGGHVGGSSMRIPLQRVELSVVGLSAEQTAPLAGRLEKVPGVRRALVNLIMRRTVIEFDPVETTVSKLTEVLEGWGTRAGHSLARWHVQVPAAACAACAERWEEMAAGVPGVHGATANREAASLTLEFTPSEIAVDALYRVLSGHVRDLWNLRGLGFGLPDASDALRQPPPSFP